MKKGEVMPEEQRAKIRLSKIGSTPSPQNRAVVSLAMRGNKFALGNKLSPETREKMSRAKKGIKKSAEWRKNLSLAKSGEKNYNWRGGKSREPYQLGWNALAKEIKARDDRLCQHPGCYRPESSEAHHVHHIDFQKGNNDPGNLITLCRGHHVSTYFGEIDYWVGFYQSVQEMRGINPHQKGGF